MCYRPESEKELEADEVFTITKIYSLPTFKFPSACLVLHCSYTKITIAIPNFIPYLLTYSNLHFDSIVLLHGFAGPTLNKLIFRLFLRAHLRNIAALSTRPASLEENTAQLGYLRGCTRTRTCRYPVRRLNIAHANMPTFKTSAQLAAYATC